MTKQPVGRRIPVVLPLVEVTVDADGAAGVVIDGAPHDTPEQVDRDGVSAVLRTLAERHGPVRVRITECDGSEYTDVIVPDPADATSPQTEPSESVPAVAGAGFLPDEDVDIAVIVARQKADSKGDAQLRLPPVLLTRANVLVLIGRSSGAVAVCDPA